MVASVIVNIINKQLNREFDYIIPPHLEGIVKIGFRVKVSFNKRIVTGYVVKIKDTSEYNFKMKPILELVDTYQVINEELRDLAYYISTNNYSYYALALDIMIPSALKLKYDKIAIVINNEENKLRNFTRKGIIKIDSLNEESLKALYDGVKSNVYKLDIQIKKNRNEKLISHIEVNPLYFDYLTKKEQELLDYLEEVGKISLEDFLNDSGYSKEMVNKLIKRNAINVTHTELIECKEIPDIIDNKVVLNDSQNMAIAQVKFNESQTYLLHGVTGSGKTEIYMNLIQKSLDLGKEAIMLVPEISLTPQITGLFLARFKSNIAIMHSRLSVKDKYEQWKRILNKEVKIVVGARSAIFSPFENIGIIIIDEEHEKSYSQDNNPKYDAIDIAINRSNNHNCPLILGSATPNVCDYYKAINNDYKLITLSKRANNNQLPKATVVDMTEELKCGNRSAFSRLLKEKIIENYKNKHQSILFLNRRGFSSFVMCRECGEVVKCPHCDVSLTYHDRINSLICHHCGYSIPNVSVCSNCGSSKIKFVGFGTEKLEDEMVKLLPQARILRMDYDTTSKLSSYEEAYNKIKNNEVDILIGTQMIAKGLDFDNVSLVGVINADLALKYPEYDSREIAFDLIEQVSGRAGRKVILGETIIQTYSKDSFTIQYAKNHDYEGFFNKEISFRELSLMPPFSTYIKIIVSSKNVSMAYDEALKILKSLKSASSDNSLILGPTKDFIFKKRDFYRYKIEIQATTDKVLEQIKYIYPLYQNNKDVDISITRM